MGAFVVVGAGPGLGAAAARRFGRTGYPVGLIARSAENPDKVAAGLIYEGITATTECGDVTDERAITDDQLMPVIANSIGLAAKRPAWCRRCAGTLCSELCRR